MFTRRDLRVLAIAAVLSAPSMGWAQNGTTAAPAPAPTLTAAERAKYVSDWDLTTPDGKKMVIHIYNAGDRLRAAADGERDTLDLRYQGNDTFLGENGPPFKLTVIFANAVPVRLHLVDPGGDELDAVARHDASPAAPAAPAQTGAPVKPTSSGPVSLRALVTANALEVVNRSASALPTGERDGVRLDEKPDDGFAWIPGSSFANGVLEIDLRGRDELQRSFLGLAFHGADARAAEVVYLRPFNFGVADSTRRVHAIQYVALPSYDFAHLRAARPGEFEAAIVPAPKPTDWVHLKLVVAGDRVSAYVNGADRPVLSVTRLSSATNGRVGLWVGNNSDGEFANLRIVPSAN